MTKRLTEILYSLYRFRFLTGHQIQALLNHKHYNRINIWLNKLTDTGNIRRYYDKKNVTVPAIYSLGNTGRKFLLKNAQELKVKPQLLNRVWRESSLSKQFQEHCLLVADIYLSLIKLTKETNATLHFYTKPELSGLKYLILPNPDTYFSIEEINGHKKAYFLDIFDPLPARMVLRKRIRQYTEYYDNEFWQDHNTIPFPSIIFICPDARSRNYLNTHIGERLTEFPDMAFYLATQEEIHKSGFNREVLHKVIADES